MWLPLNNLSKTHDTYFKIEKHQEKHMIQPEEVEEFLQNLKYSDNAAYIRRLLSGNKNWVGGNPQVHDQRKLRTELAQTQDPKIVILTCADSRLSPEYIFDANIGELFVIRIAGNVVTPEILASVEFSIEELDSTLICVLGHENCGAVQSTLKNMEHAFVSSSNLLSVLNKIKASPELSINENVITNIKSQTQLVKKNSYIVSSKNAAGRLDIIGMYYSLETGEVSLLNYQE